MAFRVEKIIVGCDPPGAAIATNRMLTQAGRMVELYHSGHLGLMENPARVRRTRRIRRIKRVRRIRRIKRERKTTRGAPATRIPTMSLIPKIRRKRIRKRKVQSPNPRILRDRMLVV